MVKAWAVKGRSCYGSDGRDTEGADGWMGRVPTNSQGSIWMGSSFEKLISSVSVSTSREEEGRKATIIASDSTETRAISERGRRLLGSILK